MEPVLTLLAGYWIFRGLEALVREDERSKVAGRELELKAEVERLKASPAPKPPVVEPTVRGKPLRTPTGTRYADAKSLFGAEYVSFTRLATFNKCPHKFKLTYLEGFREEERDKSRQASAGDKFHTLCEDLFNRYRDRPLGKALEDPVALAEPRIRKVLDAVPSDSVVLASELELRFRANGREFLGYVDLAVELPDTTVGLIDFKTGYRDVRFPPEPLQMDIYSIPELLLRPERSVLLAFVLVDADRTLSWTNGPKNRDEVVKRVRQQIVQVEREQNFARHISGLCRYCHVQDICETGAASVFRQFADRQRSNNRASARPSQPGPDSDSIAF